jgi:hypothetical protein
MATIRFDSVAAANDLAARLVVEEGWSIEKALSQTGIATTEGVQERIEYHQDRQERHQRGDVSTDTLQLRRHDTQITPHVRIRPVGQR